MKKRIPPYSLEPPYSFLQVLADWAEANNAFGKIQEHRAEIEICIMRRKLSAANRKRLERRIQDIAKRGMVG